jgi:hypothetical protein
MNAVAGEPFEQEFVWEAVERSSELAWVREVRLEPTAKAYATLAVEQGALAEDGEFCSRKYRIVFRAKTATCGLHQGFLVLKSDSGHPVGGPFPWTLTILPAIAVIPARLPVPAVLERGQAAPQVTVVSRLSTPRDVCTYFDTTVLDVLPLQSGPGRRVTKFEVRPHAGANQRQETQVLFVAEGVEPGVLTVQMLPNARSD